jgi:hypothetical protein
MEESQEKWLNSSSKALIPASMAIFKHLCLNVWLEDNNLNIGSPTKSLVIKKCSRLGILLLRT